MQLKALNYEPYNYEPYKWMDGRRDVAWDGDRHPSGDPAGRRDHQDVQEIIGVHDTPVTWRVNLAGILQGLAPAT